MGRLGICGALPPPKRFFKKFPIMGLCPIELLWYIGAVSFYLTLKGGHPMEQQKKDLPACPVETTLTLIGDK